MKVEEIAQKIKETKASIILLFAFNGTGKTRLSVEYKNLTKKLNGGNHTGIYYNAFSEDLFVWDNDEENENQNIRLTIVPSSLNRFHTFLNEQVVLEKLNRFNPTFSFKFNDHDDREDGIESVSFFSGPNPNEGNPIKISRGEERIFVWCFFLALFEVDAWRDAQSAHVFIDDPVSSLDDYNIFNTANSIMEIIEKNYISRTVIVSTHHLGLFSILFDRLKKGEKSATFKDLTQPYILSKFDGKLRLKTPRNDVFLFHLQLLRTINDVVPNKLLRYHFVLLRQVLENIGSFLGVGNITYPLERIGIAKANDVANMINALSHQNVYMYQSTELAETERVQFVEVFSKIQTTYQFVLHS